MGAWIETLESATPNNVSAPSHPVWVRGLKLPSFDALMYNAGVAPRVGAWIETRAQTASENSFRSHPVWVRGLKPKVSRL